MSETSIATCTTRIDTLYVLKTLVERHDPELNDMQIESIGNGKRRAAPTIQVSALSALIRDRVVAASRAKCARPPSS